MLVLYGAWQIHGYLEHEHVQERPQWEIIRAFQGLAVVEHNEVPSFLYTV
jgi:hypothetical protein